MPTVAYVRWFDASYQRGECTEDELTPRVEMDSAGILVREDADTVSLALDQYDGDGTWRHIEHIPRVNILRLVKLPVAEAEKDRPLHLEEFRLPIGCSVCGDEPVRRYKKNTETMGYVRCVCKHHEHMADPTSGWTYCPPDPLGF